MYQPGSPSHSIDAETACIPKHIEYLSTFGILPHQFAVFALINEKAGLLALHPVHMEAVSILQHLAPFLISHEKPGCASNSRLIRQG